MMPIRRRPLLCFVQQPLAVSLRQMRALLRNRPDTEHELTVNRLILSSGVILYFVVAGAFGSQSATEALALAGWPVAVFELIAATHFIHILLYPGVSAVRRLVGIVADVSIFSYGMHISGEAGATLFLVYFWAVLGNGFRFGVTYLGLAAGAAVIGFAAVYMTTPYWNNHANLAIGLVAALIVIPAYTSSLIRKLSAAKREAEEASRAKSLFLASMSHELRTPLNAIIGLSDLLDSSKLKSEYREMARIIGQSGRSLLSLIEAVLDFSRIEAGQTKIRKEDINLPALLTEVRSIINVSAKAKGLRIALHLGHGVPECVRSDRRHLQEILLNLSSNAVKFTDAGHIRIELNFTPNDSGGILHVAVADTGIGIDESAHARIFDRFTQADGTIMDRFGGTGLGLAIVRQLVRAMGGDISVESVLGEGSTFSFYLPVGVATSHSANSPVSPAILFADEAVDLPQVTGLLHVTSIDDARRQIARLQEAGNVRPVVLLDSAMRYPSPAKAARALLELQSGQDEPFVALLSRQDEDVTLTTAMRDLFVCVVRLQDVDTWRTLASMVRTVAKADPETDKPVSSWRSASVLIADDNKTNQMVMGKILESGGHRFEVVENGEAAVERMLKGDLDLVLMDVNMPVMNGIEATKFYRFASLGMKSIPIVAVTADATGEARQRCLDAGMDECLTKPVEAKRLLAVVEEYVQGEVAQAPTPADMLDAYADEVEAELSVERPVIDNATCEALEQLGGPEFVDALLGQFIDDSADALMALSQAVAEENVQGFRNYAHALRSAAANVGAMRIYQICLDWREINDPDLSTRGEDHLNELNTEFKRFRVEMAARKKAS